MVLTSGFDRTIPLNGCDEKFVKCFAQVSLDVDEEIPFQRRLETEPGPRLVHLRQSAIGQVTIPPHVQQNEQGIMGYQSWTKNPVVDRTMYIMDRKLELQQQ